MLLKQLSINSFIVVYFQHWLSFLSVHLSSLDYEECAHKLLKMQLKPEQMVSH